MRANKVQWTDQRERVLLELWAAGCTAGTIAAYFGVSREAILAKIYRLRHTAPSLHLAAPARRRRNKRSDRSKDVRKPRRASVLELNNTSCRWPRENRRKSAEIFFCGGTGANLEGGRPYCARHMLLAYSTPHAVE
jgi:hypothetical protein